MSELDELRFEVRRLADRESIRDVFTRFAAAMDGQDWDLLATVFADDAVFDHSVEGWNGHESAVWTGQPRIRAEVEAGAGRHFASHHVITNHRIELDGDRARVVAYLHSVHLDDPLRPDVHADHGAWYLAALVRRAAGWRISWLTHKSLWADHEYQPPGPVTDADRRAMREHVARST